MQKSLLNPYLSFNGNARAAMEFYKSVFGGKLDLNTFKEGGVPHDPSEAEHIMHGMLTADNGITIMGADMPVSLPFTPGNNYSISLSGDNEEELTEYYNKLSEGGKIGEKLAKAPWGDTFGMFTDKFGVAWMVNVAGPKA